VIATALALTLLVVEVLGLVCVELLVRTSSVLSAGVSSTVEALRFTPAVVATDDDVGGSQQLSPFLSQHLARNSFSSSCRPCDVALIRRLL